VQPNVILINCDDLGYGDLGCYGSTLNKTPAIDKLASEGLRCDAFYMASPVCSPSRGALLTGCYPPRIGFGSFGRAPVLFPGHAIGLPTTEVSLATVLSNAGYRTQMIGKWHCGDQPGFLRIMASITTSDSPTPMTWVAKPTDHRCFRRCHRFRC
jgi:arylsulfatase A